MHGNAIFASLETRSPPGLASLNDFSHTSPIFQANRFCLQQIHRLESYCLRGPVACEGFKRVIHKRDPTFFVLYLDRVSDVLESRRQQAAFTLCTRQFTRLIRDHLADRTQKLVDLPR